MSTWITITDKADLDHDTVQDTLDVLISSDNYGNNYVSIPVEYIKEILNLE